MKKTFCVLVSLLLLCAISVIFVHADVITPMPVDVTLTSYFDAENHPTTTFTGGTAKTYGTVLSMSGDLESEPGYVFAFWIVNGVVRKDLALGTTFVMTDNLELKAVFHPTSPLKYAVAFLDSNGQLIDLQYVVPGENAVAPSTASLSKPGYTPGGWSLSYTNVTDNVATILRYTINDPAASYALTVTNGTGSGSYAFNSVATVVANVPAEGMYFGGWVDANGTVVSNQTTYSFTVLENTSVTANYNGSGTIPNNPLVTLDDKYSLRSGKSSFLAQFYIPTGFTLVEFGTIVANVNTWFDLDTVGITKHQGKKYFEVTNEWLTSITATDGECIKSYLVVENTSSHELFSYYSPMRYIKDLIISEYGEGTANNKWIEIYNPSAYAADLGQYTLKLFPDGSATPSVSVDLSGSLAAGEVYVITNAGANATILAQSDLSSTVASFTGDDALGLYHYSDLIDQFGVIGVDPGTSWIVGTGATAEYTLVRITSLDCPNAVFATAEWGVHPQDTTSYLGYHANQALVSINITGSTSVIVGNTITLAVAYTPNDSPHGVTWTSSSETVATVNATTGVVTGVAEGAVTITATSTANGSITDTHAVSVSYAISFNSNGGSAVSAITQLAGTSVSAPADPTKAGMTFAGWYSNEALTAYYTFTTMPAANVTLYADWGTTGLGFELIGDEYSVSNGTAAATNVVIPRRYNGHLVTGISADGFRDCTGIISIAIPSSVTSIGNAAFRDCSGLTSITIPAGVTAIGTSTFHGCSSLSGIAIPAAVTSIGDYAFYNCSNMTSLAFASGSQLTSIGDSAFSNCTNLTGITIPANVSSISTYAFSCSGFTSILVDAGNASFASDGGVLFNKLKTLLIAYPYGNAATDYHVLAGVTTIGAGAFDSIANLHTVTIAASVTTIADSAFYGCSNITGITFESGSHLTTIADYAFNSCYNLASITIPAAVTSIGGQVFRDCYSLASVTFEAVSQLASIGSQAFYYCNHLLAITIPASVTSIGEGAFYYCSLLATFAFEAGINLTAIGSEVFYNCDALTSVTIPASVTSINASAFRACDVLVNIIVEEANTAYTSESGVLYNKAMTMLVAYPLGKTATAYTIPSGVTDIGTQAFYQNTTLLSVTLSSDVTSVGNSAFYDCGNLTTFTTSAGLESIGSDAFYGCYSLTSIVIPASVTYIGATAFYYYDTRSLTINVVAASKPAGWDNSWNHGGGTVVWGYVG